MHVVYYDRRSGIPNGNGNPTGMGIRVTGMGKSENTRRRNGNDPYSHGKKISTDFLLLWTCIGLQTNPVYTDIEVEGSMCYYSTATDITF